MVIEQSAEYLRNWVLGISILGIIYIWVTRIQPTIIKRWWSLYRTPTKEDILMKFWGDMTHSMKLWFTTGWFCLFSLVMIHLIHPRDVKSHVLLLLGAFVSFLTVMVEGDRCLHQNTKEVIM